MVKNVICPKCHEKGSLQAKIIKGVRYWRMGHYAGLQGNTRKTKWFYIGRQMPEELQVLTQTGYKLTQDLTQSSYTTERTDSSSFSQDSPELEVGLLGFEPKSREPKSHSLDQASLDICAY